MSKKPTLEKPSLFSHMSRSEIANDPSATVREQLRSGNSPHGWLDGFLCAPPDVYHVDYSGIPYYDDEEHYLPFDRDHWHQFKVRQYPHREIEPRPLYPEDKPYFNALLKELQAPGDAVAMDIQADGEEITMIFGRFHLIGYLVKSMSGQYSYDETMSDLFDLPEVPGRAVITSIELI